MNRAILLILFFNIYNLLYGQAYDKNWIFGYTGADKPDYPEFGTTLFTFYKDSTKIYPKWFDMDFFKTNVCMSDSMGNLQFSSNLARVMGKDGKYVLNGDTLLKGKASDYKYGYNTSQAMLALPMPNNKNQYLLIYSKWLLDYSIPLYTSIYDASIGTNGGIIEKNKILLNEKVGIGKITACKHGNGRDWWIRVPNNEVGHYLFLLDNKGIKLHSKQIIGKKIEEGLGQAVFSPDGKRFVELNTISKNLGMDIDIYDFDRCSGLLSNFKQIHFDSSTFVGCAISSNSRFLYFGNGFKLLQYDLEVTNIKASETLIAVWDGFGDFAMTGFQHMQLAPDNKIYVATNGTTRYMHTINKPNEKGEVCDLRQHNIKLFGYSARCVPNNPNYRLGALKGSPCDTLNSIATKNIENQYNIKIFPNPAQDAATVVWQNDNNETTTILLRDVLGRIVQSHTSTDTSLTINTSDCTSGFYFIEVINQSQKEKSQLKLSINK